jgi:hypothetical protein
LLPPCNAHAAAETIASLTEALVSQGLDVAAAFRQILNPAPVPPVLPKASCQATPLLSLIPENTGGYFPNPANKYITVPDSVSNPTDS